MRLYQLYTTQNINKTKVNNQTFGKKLQQTQCDSFEHSSNRNKESKQNYISISKNMAYALRHNPQGCGLCLDETGAVDINSLLYYLNSQKKWPTLSRTDIEETIKNIEKKRFELDGEKIRAYYGHSFSKKLKKEAGTPPPILYHGTSKEATEHIKEEGITSQKRQFVHMSTDLKTANSVGQRKDKKPIILQIDTVSAQKDGIIFYLGNDNVWLADYIPPQYINFPE